MDAGIPGAHGAAAARRVVVASSRGKEFVKDLSLEENHALVTEESRSVAMRRDALVGPPTALQRLRTDLRLF